MESLVTPTPQPCTVVPRGRLSTSSRSSKKNNQEQAHRGLLTQKVHVYRKSYVFGDDVTGVGVLNYFVH